MNIHIIKSKFLIVSCLTKLKFPMKLASLGILVLRIINID